MPAAPYFAQLLEGGGCFANPVFQLLLKVIGVTDGTAQICEILYLLIFLLVDEDLCWRWVLSTQHVVCLLRADDQFNVASESADFIYQKLQLGWDVGKCCDVVGEV